MCLVWQCVHPFWLCTGSVLPSQGMPTYLYLQRNPLHSNHYTQPHFHGDHHHSCSQFQQFYTNTAFHSILGLDHNSILHWTNCGGQKCVCLCISVCPALNLWFSPDIPEARLGCFGCFGKASRRIKKWKLGKKREIAPLSKACHCGVCGTSAVCWGGYPQPPGAYDSWAKHMFAFVEMTLLLVGWSCL